MQPMYIVHVSNLTIGGGGGGGILGYFEELCKNQEISNKQFYESPKKTFEKKTSVTRAPQINAGNQEPQRTTKVKTRRNLKAKRSW